MDKEQEIERVGDFFKPKIEVSCARLGLPLRRSGTVVVIQGPRFNTKAESEFQIRQGWDLVNMTQYPECVFAKELGLCYATIASITDWDVGVETGQALSMGAKNMAKILEIFRHNTQSTLQLLEQIASCVPEFRCQCAADVMRPYYEDAGKNQSKGTKL